VLWLVVRLVLLAVPNVVVYVVVVSWLVLDAVAKLVV